MNLGAVFFVANLTCSFHMLHTWPTQFYVGPPTSTFLATLVVPCALMSIVLTPPILLPDYWLICPTCIFLVTSFAPFIISLCLQSCASSSLHVSCLPCRALSCLAKPASCPVFPLRGSFCCLFCFIFD